jgi:LEA14-like dessication related protein
MKSLIKISLVFILLFFVLACSVIKEPKLISIDKMEIKSVDDSENEISINSEIKIYNPNWINLNSKDINFNVFIDTICVGKANLIEDLKLKNRDTSNVKICLKLKRTFLESKLIFNDSISFKIKGSAKISFLPKRYYFNLKYDIKLSDLINNLTNGLVNDENIKIKNINLISLNISNIQFDLLFNIKNDVKIDYEINKLDVNFYSNKSYKNLVGNTSLEKPFTVKGNNINELLTTVNIDPLKLGSSLISNILNNDKTIYIKINSLIIYKNIQIPFIIKKEATFNPLTLKIRLK